MTSEAPRMVGPASVRRALSCGRAAAYAVMERLGGQRVPGLGWRVSERKLIEYVRRLERGDTWTRSSRSSNAAATGTATSERQTASDISEPCISETTAAESQSAPPSPPTGKSKHALRLAHMIAQLESGSRSRKRSTHSAKHKNSRASVTTTSKHAPTAGDA